MIDIEKKERQLANRLQTYTGSFMNNTKWYELFKVLSAHSSMISKCYIKSVYFEISTEPIYRIEIPDTEHFEMTFHQSGIKDVLTGGPMTFKEIESVIFPKTWQIDRVARGEVLQPKIFTQDLQKIESIIRQAMIVEMDYVNNDLVVFGYR